MRPLLALPLLALLLLAFALAGCDGADPDPDPDPPDPDPDPQPVVVEGLYVAHWTAGARAYCMELGLEDDDRRLSGTLVTLVTRYGNITDINVGNGAGGTHNDELVTLTGTFAGGAVEPFAFNGEVLADGDRLRGALSGYADGVSFAAGGVVFLRTPQDAPPGGRCTA